MNPKTRLHVMHVIGSDGLYGAEKWIIAFLQGVIRHECPIRFSLINLTEDRNGPSHIIGAVKDLGISAFDFFTGGRFNPLAGITIGRWAKSTGVHIIHSHGYKADTIGLIASLFSRSRIVTTPHGWSLEKDLKLNLYERFDRFLFRFMDRVVPLSPQLYIDLTDNRFLTNNISLIVNGVDIDEIDEITRAVKRDESKENFVIGYMGQLIERKNVICLLRAIQIVAKTRRNVKLTMVGDGHLRSYLEHEARKCGISSHVTFCGFRQDALKILATMDLFVLPSLMEGIPRCVMEAMAAMVPVVASDIPGNRELIIHGKTGLLFNPHKPEELVEAIEHVMDNPESAKTRAKNARKKIENKYSNHRMAQEYLELYDSLFRHV